MPSQPRDPWSALPELTEADRAHARSLAVEVAYRDTEPIVVAGAPSSGLWAIQAGAARVLLGDGSRQRELARLGPGELFGEMSLLTGEPASAHVVADGACRVTRIERGVFDALAVHEPAFATRLVRALARVIAGRLRDRNGPVPSTARDPAEGWTATIASLRDLRLPPLVEDYVARYEQVGHRTAYLWRWCWRALEETMLPSVPAEAREQVVVTKLLAVMVNALIDDIADRQGTLEELEAALAIPLGGSNAAPAAGDLDPAWPRQALIADLWATVEARVRGLPRASRYLALYRFDCQQVWNCMRYALLTQTTPALDNLSENRAYSPHNMNMMVFATIDLMASAVPDEDLGVVREAAYLAQSMGRIANMTATWRREVPDRDFTSRIFTVARDEGALSAGDLATLPDAEIVLRVERSGAEHRLLDEWRGLRDRLERLVARPTSVDLHRVAQGSDNLLGMHLAARGRI